MRSPAPASNGTGDQSPREFAVNRLSEVGLALAVLASLITFTFPAWPIVGPMALGDAGAVWTGCVWLVAGAFIVAAWLAEDHPVLARLMLLVGVSVLVGVGLASGRIVAAWELGLPFGLLALVPALLGLSSACLIGPVHQPGQTVPATAGQSFREPRRIGQEAESHSEERDATRPAS